MIDVETHCTDVLSEVDLNSRLRRAECVSQRRELTYRFRNLHSVVGALYAERRECALNSRDGVHILYSKNELARFLIVIGEDCSAERHHRWRRLGEQGGEAVLASATCKRRRRRRLDWIRGIGAGSQRHDGCGEEKA